MADKSTTPRNTRSRKGSLKENITTEDISALVSAISRESEVCIISSLKAEISALSDRVSKLESKLGSVQAECIALESDVHRMKRILVAQQQDIEKNENF